METEGDGELPSQANKLEAIKYNYLLSSLLLIYASLNQCNDGIVMSTSFG